MRHIGKQALSLLLALLLCLGFSPAALAEEGTIRPAEDGEESGLSGTPAPTEEDETGNQVGDGVLDVPSNNLAEPAADEVQEIVASGKCGANLTWTLDDAGLLTISGTGEMFSWVSNGSPWYSLRDSIVEVRLSEELTAIGRGAFYELSKLSNVTIPPSVNSIGEDAFRHCENLEVVVIPSSITKFGQYAFGNCNNIHAVYIEDFDWWLSLPDTTGYDLPHGNLYLNEELLTEIAIPDGTTELRRRIFSNMEALSTISLPNTISSIGYSAFSGCSNLTSVTIPDNVSSIEGNTFYGCKSLVNVSIPESVTSIGDSAFYGCNSLASIELPSSVRILGNYVFHSCNSLISFTIPDGITSVGLGLFYKCGNLKSVTMPNSVTKIVNYAFYCCDNLSSVTIPVSVTSIGKDAFQGCSGLKTVTFLGNAPTIAEDAFFGYTPTEGSPQYVRATALYPIDDSSWTTDKLVNYGATTLLWVGYRDNAKAYTIHYDANGGDVVPADQIKGHGVSIQLNDVIPVRSGYTFSGWATNPESTEADYEPGAIYTADQDLTLYALWENNIYTVTFAANGGSLAQASKLVTYEFEYGELPIPIRNGYIFEGWFLKLVGGEPIIPSSLVRTPRDHTLYAHWAPKTFTIQYDANGGDGAPEAQIKTYGIDLHLSEVEPTRKDYAFLGWATNRNAVIAEYMPNAVFSLEKDTMLYAVWKWEAPCVATDAVLSLSSMTACTGREFSIELLLEKNPGIMFLSFRIDYDADSLEFLGAEDEIFTGWTVNTSNGTLVWDDDRNQTENGCLLRLLFRAKENARLGDTTITISDLLAANYAEEILGVEITPGIVTILPHTPGDVNGNGTVDGLDLIRIRKFLVGISEVEIVQSNADMNEDSKVDILDLIRLRKYLAGLE